MKTFAPTSRFLLCADAYKRADQCHEISDFKSVPIEYQLFQQLKAIVIHTSPLVLEGKNLFTVSYKATKMGWPRLADYCSNSKLNCYFYYLQYNLLNPCLFSIKWGSLNKH